MKSRDVRTVVASQPTSDGAGVKLNRALGTRALSMLDPFLMLDEFRSDKAGDYIAGFPAHPHRGFETVTYMLHGAMEHRDSMGNQGRLVSGSVQWMTAGSGIIHSEMPQQESGLMAGFQLWVNLPAKLKMTRPRYQDLGPETIPEAQIGDARVRVIAGTAGGKRGPVEEIVTEPLMLDVAVPASGTFQQAIAEGHNSFVYVFEGSILVGPRRVQVQRGQLAVLDEGDTVQVSSESSGRFLLLAGRPLGEPVARQGPFVMNTREELIQAFEDYQSGRLVQS